jgi:hypothetical protein
MQSFIHSLVTVIVFGGMIPSVSLGQATGLSITSLSLVNETKVTRSISDVEYRADILNTGVARTSVTATISSTVSTIQIVRGTLHFVNVPSNGRATSTDTFVIRVDRSVPFSLSNLVWAFSAPGAPVRGRDDP